MQTFTKVERLCSKILIDNLIKNGNSFQSYPFKIVWLEVNESTAPVQVLISVPKRSFKKAVVRNKIKRRIREVYRKNKNNLYDQLNQKKIIVMFFYTSKTVMEYNEIEEKLIVGMELLNKKINK